MKIFLTILLLNVTVNILGMFYWMYKARNGTLNLKITSLHYKFMRWMWEVAPNQLKNTCPYYWSIVFSVYILPLYLIVRYMIVPIIDFISDIKLPKFNFLPKLPKINIIPQSKKQIYTKVYSKSKKWLFNLFLIILVFIAIFLLYKLFNLSSNAFYIFISIVLFGSVWLAQGILKPEWDKYFTNIVIFLFDKLKNIIIYPFEKLFSLISFIFSKVTGVVSNMCPPIKWNNMIIREDTEFIDEVS